MGDRKKDISIYLNKNETKEIKKVAGRLGLKFSSFCRMAIIKRVAEENFLLKQSKLKLEEL